MYTKIVIHIYSIYSLFFWFDALKVSYSLFARCRRNEVEIRQYGSIVMAVAEIDVENGSQAELGDNTLFYILAAYINRKKHTNDSTRLD